MPWSSWGQSKMKINRERLAETFTLLCETDSPSRQEGRMAALLKKKFTQLGAKEITEDDSAAQTGSQCGNLIIRFDGSLDLDTIFFSCHMDTVEPASGIKVQREGDMFTSAGATVLGSDDKSGIAACIELMETLQEYNIAHRPLEFVITTCEEIGLLGAKALDPEHIHGKEGYALDSTGFAKVVTQAPAANRLTITVNGVAAHAGLHPEWGVNAIAIAAKALSRCPNGRIDAETTANFGTITGGAASNIVPEKVVIEGEVRSHQVNTLHKVTREIEQACAAVAAEWNDPTGQAKGRPTIDVTVHNDFPAMLLDRKSRTIQRVEEAAKSIGLKMTYEKAGGGSDANIFNGYGLPTAIIATGMTNVHSTDECCDLQDMVDLTRLLISLSTTTTL